jgi:hypothetical protein
MASNYSTSGKLFFLSIANTQIYRKNKINKQLTNKAIKNSINKPKQIEDKTKQIINKETSYECAITPIILKSATNGIKEFFEKKIIKESKIYII